MARAGSCGSEDVSDAIGRPSSHMVIERRVVGRGLSRGRTHVVRGKIGGVNGSINGTCTNETLYTTSIHELVNHDTEDMDSRSYSEEIVNTAENVEKVLVWVLHRTYFRQYHKK